MPSVRLTKPRPSRSLRRSSTDPSVSSPGPSLSHHPLPHQQPPLDNYSPLDIARHAHSSEMDKQEEKEKSDATSLVNNASIIPDNLPAWYNKDIWASVPPPMYKAVYRIHNPIGPRWYRNYHLIPPSQLRRGARPPSFFSPSFPPMGSTSMPEHTFDSSLLTAPSRTPSGSPLPTPSSSQTRVADASNKPRSRKPSLTTPDGIEIDITDPWGATWHHPSPYDFSISSSTGNDIHTNSRPRRVSLTPYQVKRKAAPSPLSQSTSVEHLEPQGGPNVLRKPSKRRAPSIASIFGNASSGANRSAASVPTTPIDNIGTAQVVAPSSVSIMTKTSKKEKRGSVLDRLAKKLSLLRKSNEGEKSIAKEDWHHVASDNANYSQNIQPSVVAAEPSIGEVGPNPSPPLNEQVPHVSQEADRSSSISLEAPYPTGRLTVANPDLPSSEDTPAPSEAPLPPDKSDQVPIEWNSMPNQLETVQDAFLQTPGPLPSLINSDRFPDAQSSEPTPIHSPRPRPHNDMENTESAQFPHPEQSHATIESVESLPPTPPAKSRAPSPGILGPVRPTEAILQDIPANDKTFTSHDSSTIHQGTVNVQTLSRDDLRPLHTSGNDAMTHPVSDTPFPVDNGQVLVPPRARFSYTTSSDYSPMSTASMVVNPPTPYNPELSMLDTPEPPPPAFLARDKQIIVNDVMSHNGKAGSKHTETFKLVRGAFGRVHGSTDTIVAAGQHWEIIEAMEDRGNNSKQLSKSKDNGVEDGRETKEKSTGREYQRQKGQESSKEKEKRKDDRSDDKDKEKHQEGNKLVEKSSKREREAEKDRIEREKEREREREREWQRQKDLERATERERHRERDKEKERQREKERLKEKDREREREREREKEKEREKEREREREKEREQREREREREKERERERQREKERERQREKEREREKEKDRERDRERAREKERERERERERQKEREERLRDKEREKERQREKDREKARQEKERHREKERKEKKEKERDKREHGKSTRRSEEHFRIHPEGPRQRTTSQANINQKSDTRGASVSTFPPGQILAEVRSIYGRSGDHEGNRTWHSERIDAGRGNNDSPAVSQINRPPLERNPSASTRPTSELPSAAELIALRAKEAFEMERLFKARSLYGQELDAYAPNSIPSSVASESASSTGAIYGSSHTAYVVQTSFQTSHNAPAPQMHDLQHDPSRPASYLSDNDLLSIPSLDSSNNRRLSNPLPAPPRQSAYQPMPLSFLESNGTYSSDWTKYTVTTAH